MSSLPKIGLKLLHDLELYLRGGSSINHMHSLASAYHTYCGVEGESARMGLRITLRRVK